MDDSTQQSTTTVLNEYAVRGSYKYKQITCAMFIAGLCTFAQLYYLQPLLPVLSRYFGITPAHSSLVISAATLALAAGLLLGTFTADRVQRKTLMGFALTASSILTLIAAAVPNITLLIIISACKGFVLSGVAAIAMAYIGEEIHPADLSRTMSLYIIGTIMGGMAGRVAANLLAGWLSWRIVSLIVGCTCLLLSLLFWKRLPRSSHFHPRQTTARELFTGMAHYIRDPILMALCFYAGLAMGSFVSVYNYLGFRLESPPFSLPHQLIAGIFMMYAAGIGGSFLASRLSERLGTYQALRVFALLSLLGIILTYPNQAGLIVIGLAMLTFSFFGGHTIASSLASTRTPQNRAVASSLYLLFYYAGSSLLGTYSGVIMHASGWSGVTVLLSCVLAVALLLTLLIKSKQVL